MNIRAYLAAVGCALLTAASTSSHAAAASALADGACRRSTKASVIAALNSFRILFASPLKTASSVAAIRNAASAAAIFWVSFPVWAR